MRQGKGGGGGQHLPEVTQKAKFCIVLFWGRGKLGKSLRWHTSPSRAVTNSSSAVFLTRLEYYFCSLTGSYTNKPRV